MKYRDYVRKKSHEKSITRTSSNSGVIGTIEPDSRGRASLSKYLEMIGWEPGQCVELHFVRTVKIEKPHINL